MKTIYKMCRSALFDKNSVSQFKRYLTTGFLSVALEYSTLFVLTNFIGLWHIVSNSIAVAVSFGFNFMLNRFWSFKSKQDIKGQLLQYGTLFAINMAISNGIIYVFSDLMKIHYFIPKIASTALITIWNFILYKKVIYK